MKDLSNLETISEFNKKIVREDNTSENNISTGNAAEQSDQASANNADKTISQKNAFDFMMNARHRRIGRNSPGRELNETEVFDKDTNRDTARSRKVFLAKWAEAKGASRQRHEYEEVGKCIENKLKKREKNFKRMLNIGSNDNVSKKKKVSRVIESDEENKS